MSASLTVVIDNPHLLGAVCGPNDRNLQEISSLLSSPVHPYMKALIAANPSMGRRGDTRLQEIKGQPPRPGARPRGCAFAPRCPVAMDRCAKEIPPLLSVEEGHGAACWLVK